MAKEIKTRARSLESILEGVEIKHPLVRRFAPTKYRYLITRIQSSTPSSSPSVGYRVCRRGADLHEKTGPENPAEEESPIQKESPPPGPSSNAILTSLFGWSLVSSVQPLPQSTTPSPYLSRASSVAPAENPSTSSIPASDASAALRCE
jgi:hypothetical protein